MGSVGFLFVLVVASVVSTQLMLTTKPGQPLDKRLRDLGTGGDAFGLLIAALLTLTAAGAVVGSLSDAPGIGAAIGLVLALTIWTAAVILAHRRR